MDLLKKYGLIILTAGAILAALIVYSLNVPRNRESNLIERVIMTVVTPVLKPATRVSVFFKDVWDGYINLVDVRHENQRLLRQVKELNARVVAGNEDFQANQRLTRLLD